MFVISVIQVMFVIHIPERAWIFPRLMHWRNHSDRSVQQEGTCSVVAHLTDTRASRF